VPRSAARERLGEAHAEVGARVRPGYALNDIQSASTTVRRGRRSCSQRLAVLEAVHRWPVRSQPQGGA
jgi:hypothetical protein